MKQPATVEWKTPCACHPMRPKQLRVTTVRGHVDWPILIMPDRLLLWNWPEVVPAYLKRQALREAVAAYEARREASV